MKIDHKAKLICQVLQVHGYQAWLVGGAIRDSIMGREVHDWDIATNARPEQVTNLFARVIPTGIAHGTVTVLLNGVGYEVTTFRGDGEYTDGRRPDGVVFLDTIEEDLARRDFTMNAIAYDPVNEVFCDPFGGREDIKNRVIRAVGDPLKRFSEDGLRVLRACRFAATLGFELDETTENAIRPSLDSYKKVACERIKDEWMKAMGADKPSKAFEAMRRTGILDVTVPEMVPMFDCTQNRYHAYDVWTHTLAVVDACPKDDPILRMAALLHDVSKPATKGIHPKTGDATFYNHEDVGADVAYEIMSRLRFSNEDRDRVKHLVKHHLIKYQPDWANSAIRRWVRKVGPEHVASLCALARADIVGKGPAMVALDIDVMYDLERRVAELSKHVPVATKSNDLAINGKDVMAAFNLNPGPQVGKILKALLEDVTDNPELNEREALLHHLSTKSVEDWLAEVAR